MIVGFLFGYGGSQYVPSTPAVVPTPATTPINRRLFCLRLLPSRVTTVVRVVQYVRQIFGHFFFAHLFRVKTAKTYRGKTSFSALFFMLEL